MVDLNKKLLAEAFDAFVSENDIAKATRLFQRHWNLVAKNNFALLESEDEDFEVNNMGDDFNADIVDEAGSDKEQQFEQLQIAVDELEDKYPAEMTEEVQAKFDDLRNAIDEMKLAEEDDEVSSEDVIVIIEDLKADFEVAGEISEEVQALFDEISAGLQGDADVEEIEVEDEFDADEEFEDEEEDLEEAEDMNLDVDFEESEESEEDPIEGEESEEDPIEGEEESDEDIIYDAKEKAEELLAKLEELEALEGEEDGLNEGWEKTKLPRNKLQNEEEGVKKEGMKFAKPTSIPARKGMAVSNSVSAGISADKKVKVCKTENKGAKSWSKVAKPSNNAADGKSPLGK
jgi:molybdopterin converting factor small subunit